jgi:hypothetical protein
VTTPIVSTNRHHRTACMSPPVPGEHLGRPQPVTTGGGDDGGGWRHVLVESEKVGSVTRNGVVTAIDGRLITVRWDTGSESVFVPSAGSLQVTGHESAVGRQIAPDLGRRAPSPHPYQRSTAKRHANQRFPRSDDSVMAVGMG